MVILHLDGHHAALLGDVGGGVHVVAAQADLDVGAADQLLPLGFRVAVLELGDGLDDDLAEDGRAAADVEHPLEVHQLARQFVSELLVVRGMIADFAIHQPDKDGNRIIGEDGKPLFDAVPTTDWGSPETLEHWREAWAAMVNAKFEEKGLACRIDHRSYERQGLDLLPTIHEGVAVRQMEAKGITTDKGDLNRWIRKANNILRDIRKKIASLADWIKAIKEELSQPQAPTLAVLLTDYYEGRNAGAWSRNAKIGNLKDFAEAVNFLTEKDIVTLEDLEAHIAAQGERAEAINTSMKAKRDRLNELKELLRLVDLYRDTKPIYDEWKGIKWKGKRENFEREHEGELRTFHMARRKLDKYRSPAGKIPAHAWEQEQARLQQEYKAEYEQYKPILDDLRRLQQVKRNADTAIHQQEQTRQKRREAER